MSFAIHLVLHISGLVLSLVNDNYYLSNKFHSKMYTIMGQVTLHMFNDQG